MLAADWTDAGRRCVVTSSGALPLRLGYREIDLERLGEPGQVLAAAVYRPPSPGLSPACDTMSPPACGRPTRDGVSWDRVPAPTSYRVIQYVISAQLRRLTAAVVIALAAIATVVGVAAARPAHETATKKVYDEFQDPSWTSLPARSIFNRLPSCRLDSGDSYTCLLPLNGSGPAADPDNPEFYANSAYWPAEQRPDIEVYAMNRYGYFCDGSAQHSVHYCFYVDAKKVGYPISHTPQVGDLAVYPTGCAPTGPNTAPPANCDGGADSSWYAEYVQRVLPNGAFVGSGGGAADYYSSSYNSIDSGVIEQEISAKADPYAYFIGLMPKQRARKAPKHRRLEPTNLVRFRTYPTTADPALKVRFWLSKAASRVKVKLDEQYGPTSPITLHHVSAGSHDVSLPLSSRDRQEFATEPYVEVYFELTVGSVHYDGPETSIAAK